MKRELDDAREEIKWLRTELNLYKAREATLPPVTPAIQAAATSALPVSTYIPPVLGGLRYLQTRELGGHVPRQRMMNPQEVNKLAEVTWDTVCDEEMRRWVLIDEDKNPYLVDNLRYRGLCRLVNQMWDKKIWEFYPSRRTEVIRETGRPEPTNTWEMFYAVMDYMTLRTDAELKAIVENTSPHPSRNALSLSQVFWMGMAQLEILRRAGELPNIHEIIRPRMEAYRRRLASWDGQGSP